MILSHTPDESNRKHTDHHDDYNAVIAEHRLNWLRHKCGILEDLETERLRLSNRRGLVIDEDRRP